MSISTKSSARKQALRACAAWLCCTALGACSSDDGVSGRSPITIADTLWTGMSGSGEITLAEAAAVPFTSIGYRVGGGSEQMLALMRDFGPDSVWSAASHLVLVTRGGRIIQTEGFAHNLARSALRSGDSDALPAIAQGRPAQYLRTADFADLNVEAVTISCEARAVGAETISILGSNLATERVEEACKCPRLKWAFTNIYWVGGGRIWRSVQTIHPDLPPVTVQILRAPA